MNSLGGDFEEAGSRREDGEGVGLEIRTPHELGRVARDAVAPEVSLIFRDQVGGDDDEGVWVRAEPQEESIRLADGGRGGRGRRARGVL